MIFYIQCLKNVLAYPSYWYPVDNNYQPSGGALYNPQVPGQMLGSQPGVFQVGLDGQPAWTDYVQPQGVLDQQWYNPW